MRQDCPSQADSVSKKVAMYTDHCKSNHGLQWNMHTEGWWKKGGHSLTRVSKSLKTTHHGPGIMGVIFLANRLYHAYLLLKSSGRDFIYFPSQIHSIFQKCPIQHILILRYWNTPLLTSVWKIIKKKIMASKIPQTCRNLWESVWNKADFPTPWTQFSFYCLLNVDTRP